jgi:hypothetical protein
LRRSLHRSRKGMSTIVAEVLMVLVVIILSSIIYIWVVPTFQSAEVQGNSGAAYAEKFSTLWGNFATFAPSIPESLIGAAHSFPSSTSCTSSITSATTHNIIVPANSVCVITANVGNVFVDSGANLTVVGATINGQLMAQSAASVTLRNARVTDWTDLENVGVLNISGSSFNTSGDTGNCTDNCDSAIYSGGRGIVNFVNNTVNGMFESEVSHQAFISGNNINGGRLEVESADFGQITNNKIGVLDLDQNGILVISGNTIYGNDPSYSGKGILYGLNRWCATGNNVIISGSNNQASCIGNIEVDVQNTGSIPVNLVAAYMSNIPLAGPISWKLGSGGSVHNSLPISIPVGQSANVTMQWTPPPGLASAPWTDIYFIFVSSHLNFVDGHIYFGYNPALTVQTQSRPENRVCPPCY